MLTNDEIRSLMPAASTSAAKAFGSRIRQSRRARGLNARQIADALGVQIGSYYHWEQGVIMPSPENLKKLSFVIGLPVEFFLDVPIPSRGNSADPPTDIAEAIFALAQMFGESGGESGKDYSKWSPAAQQYLADVLQFAIEPIPDRLSTMLSHYPVSIDGSAATARWAKRKGLVDWFLVASDAALDVVEDVVRRLGRASKEKE